MYFVHPLTDISVDISDSRPMYRLTYRSTYRPTYRSRYLPIVGRYSGRHSADTLTIDCWWSIGRLSVVYQSSVSYNISQKLRLSVTGVNKAIASGGEWRQLPPPIDQHVGRQSDNHSQSTHQPTYRSSVGRHIDRCSTDISVYMSTNTSRSTYRLTLDRYVSRHINRYLTDMSTDTSVESRRYVDQYIGRGVHKIHKIRILCQIFSASKKVGIDII